MAAHDLAPALRLLAELGPALERQDRARLQEIIGQLVSMRAPLGAQWQALAQVAVNIGELKLSRQAIDLFVEASGGTHAAKYQKAALLAEAGAVREADALLRSLPEHEPSPLANAYSRGMAALNLGEREPARRWLEQVALARPQAGSAWLALSMAVDFADEPALADRVIAAQRSLEGTEPTQHAAYFYALGKVHVDRGDHAPAFAAVARGAELMRTVVGYDQEQDRAQAAEALRGYSVETIASVARRQPEGTGRTIFLTGLPRSGTTLVERILTSHSAVGDGAELDRLALLALEIGGASFPALVRYVDAQGAASAARLWHRWLDERFTSPGRIVDKTVDASRFLGLAAALLPDAPVIWMTRDPLDRAWSCFRTNFSAGAMPWSYDLRDIAAHFRIEDRLLAEWQAILGDRLLVVSFEALVGDSPSWIRRILAHCGLAEEPEVFAPHENRQPVTTASAMQVRQPINTAGVGAAEPYRRFLEPFIAAYFD